MEEFHSEARLQEWKESIEDEIRGTWNEWCGSIYTTMMGELTVRFARERAEMEEKILLERQSIMNEVEKMIARSSEGMGRKRSEERKWEETENERKEMEKKIAEQQQEERNVKETMVGQNTEMQAENALWKCSFAQDMLSNWTEWSGVVLANIRSEFQRSVQWEREEFEERLLCERQTIIKEAETLMAGKDEAAEIESEEAGPSRQGWREEEDLIMWERESEEAGPSRQGWREEGMKQEMWERESEEAGPSRQGWREEGMKQEMWEKDQGEEYIWMEEKMEEAEEKKLFSWTNWRQFSTNKEEKKIKEKEERVQKKLAKLSQRAAEEEERAKKKWEEAGKRAEKMVGKAQKKQEEKRMKAEKEAEKAKKKLEQKEKKANEPRWWQMYDNEVCRYPNISYYM
ncbi:golgin subfamily A member 6-like protein 6 [Anguilla rostrata]|uniref:golgin subfamily A member 6-like protein 6 n=1 Tax=Anguilla rostrata TaxID=7938 RepID=UPI0030CC6C11